MSGDAPKSPEVCVLEAREALAERAPAWDALLARSAVPSPIFGAAWFQAYLDHKHPADAPWWCVVAEEDGALLGVLPLVPDPRRGGGVRVPAEYFLADGAPVLAPGREPGVARALFAGALRGIPAARRIALGQVRGGTPVHAALAALPWSVAQRAGEGAAIVVAGDFATWYGGIGSNMRRNLRKAWNRAGRDFGGEPQISFRTGAEADVDWLAELAEIEQRGWKGTEGGALGTEPKTLALYADVLGRWRDAGALEWHRLAFGDETAALHLATRIGSKLTLVRICFEERFSRYSPSGLLLKATAERAFADGGVTRIDCVQRQDWQRNWRMDEVPYHSVHVHRPGFVTAIRGLGPERLGAALRRNRLLRRVLRRGPAESA